jgi:mono/diheme cytochrome c family protein
MRFLVIAALLLLSLGGLLRTILPDRARVEPPAIAPNEVLDFDALYSANCSGCHGSNGRNGPATPLGNPTYLAIADDSAIRRATANGVPATPMPAFAQSAGGMLTDKQVEVLVNGIRMRWATPRAHAGIDLPLYSAAMGDSFRGAKAYSVYCASCHGADGTGGPKASSIVDGSFLALTSDQGLRTSVIVGHPEFGFPDWQNDLPGHPMSGQEISDVVAWMAAQRPKYPGQPYAVSPNAGGRR